MEKVYLTKDGKEKLESELNRMIRVDQVELIESLKEARETLSSITPKVSRSEIISAIQESSGRLFKSKGGSKRKCKKGGRRKTKGRK